MEREITQMVDAFEQGLLTRRQLVARMLALSAAALGLHTAARAEEEEGTTFEGTEINHVALNVTDVRRSRDFYVKHLGMEIWRRGDDSSCFLRCSERNFLALFHGTDPGMNHYCFAIPDYNPSEVVEKLKAVGLSPRREGDRIYFPDPDGITVQLAASRYGDDDA